MAAIHVGHIGPFLFKPLDTVSRFGFHLRRRRDQEFLNRGISVVAPAQMRTRDYNSSHKWLAH